MSIAARRARAADAAAWFAHGEWIAGKAIATALFCFAVLAPAASRAATFDPELRAMEAAVSDHPRAAVQQAQEWLKTSFENGDKQLQLKALRQAAMGDEQVEETAAMREAAQRGLPLARELENPVAECEFQAALAYVANSEGRYTDAIARYDDAIAYADQRGLAGSRARLLVGKAGMYSGLGRSAEALALLKEAYEYFDSNNDVMWKVAVLSSMAGVDRGDPKDPQLNRKAVDLYTQALAMLSPGHSRFDTSTLFHNLGVAYYTLKEYDQARDFFEKSLAIVKELDEPVSTAYLRYRLGQLAREEKRYADALDYFDAALPAFEKIANFNMQFGVQLGRARVLAAESRRKESLAVLEKARALGEKLKTPGATVAYLDASAEIRAQLGDYERAYADASALRAAEKARVEAANAERTAELETRFEVQQKEGENNLLRVRARESEARRLALVLALILCFLLVAGLVYILLRNSRRSRRLANLAMKDDLTDLPNRRAILEYGHLQFRGRRDSDAQMCIALIDIDHFKAINDDFGHDRGDAVLIAFARTCQQQLRSNDRIGRFGGEEFLLVMPGTELEQLPGLFERLRNAISHLRIEGLPLSRRLTFSMGAAAAETPADSLEILIKRADEALYRAKQGGRDRYEVGAQDPEKIANAAPLPARASTWVASVEHQALLKYEAIMNNASVGIAFTRDRIIQHANRVFEEMFGWPTGGMVGQPGSAVWPTPEDYQAFGREVGPLLAAGESVKIERQMKRRDGSLFLARIQARPVDLGNPSQGGTIWIIEDETERQLAEDKMQQLQEQLRAARAASSQ